MGLRNKVIHLKENLAQIHESLDTAKSSGKTDKLSNAMDAIETMEESLNSFTLEKERREKKVEVEEAEPEKEESKEEYDKD
jgi:hypothetical protein